MCFILKWFRRFKTIWMFNTRYSSRRRKRFNVE